MDNTAAESGAAVWRHLPATSEGASIFEPEPVPKAAARRDVDQLLGLVV